MRVNLTLCTIIVLALQVQAKGVFAQDKVTLHVKGVSLESVLESVRKQTGFSYAVQDQYLGAGHPVSISVEGVSLKEVLDAVFKDQPYSYELVERIIVVKKKEPEKSVIMEAGPGDPEGVVQGVVMNETGQPLSGASVQIKATGKTVLTNEKGEFKLTGVPVKGVLTITFVGYTKKEVTVTSGSPTEVRLAPAVNQLDQVQIIAYGTTTERMSTGDVTTINSQDIEKSPVSNPLEAIEGRVPGMFITQNTGMPGGSFSVQIRGQNSIANGNDPLYIIDGVPYSSELLNNFNYPGDGGNPLNFINPSDIESIAVLKDADATSIYGSRAANGAVIITTKKGREGKAKIDVNYYSADGQVGHFVKLLNTPQYLEMRHEAFANDGVTPTQASAPDLLFWDTTRYTNWQKVLIGGTAHYDDAQASVSGGSANVQYAFGGGYHRETTVFPSNFSDQKGSLHFSINGSSVNQRFKAALTGSYLIDYNKLPATDVTGVISSLAPDAPPAYLNGTMNWAPLTAGSVGTWTNPFSNFLPIYTSNTNNIVLNSVLSYQLIKGLELKASLGYTNLQGTEQQVVPLEANDPGYWSYGDVLRDGNFNNSSIRSWTVEPQIKYSRVLGAGKLEVLAGSTLLESVNNQQWLSTSGYSSDALIGDIQDASSVSVAAVTYDQYKYDALFGRANYRYMDRYIIDVTARRDGSSRFGADNQLHNFASVGGAWIFSEEHFIKNALPILSFGKARLSYGTTGNDQIGDYRFLDSYQTVQYPYEGVVGLIANNLSNPYLQWEETKKLEGGLEFGFLSDRILLSSSYYLNRSSNELVSYPLPGVTGFSSIQSNLPAVVQNAGLELTLSTVNIKTSKFGWKTNFNLTISRNKLVSYPNLSTSTYATRYVVGQPLSIEKTYHYLGVNDSTGVYEFADSKGQPTYNPNLQTDLTSLVDVQPKYYGGMENNLDYKSFHLSFFFQFVKRMGTNFRYSYSPLSPGWEGYNEPVQVLEHWQKGGDQASIQQFTQSGGSGAQNAYQNYIWLSDKAYADASFLRLKNVALSYDLPRSLSMKLHVEHFTVFIRGQNLFTLTNHYVGLDPETQSVTTLPVLRVISAGAHLTL